MLSDTLRRGLEDYAIGPTLRSLRLKKKMGLVELGRHTGLSPALLSKIERGRLFPTLPTLLRIAMVFSVGLDHFFAAPRERPARAVVRRRERKRFLERPSADESSYAFESLDFPAVERRLNGYYAEFLAPPRAARHHQHVGAELVYVIGGRVTLAFADGEEVVLEKGDAIYFDSSVAHAYRRSGRGPCTAVVVTAP